MAQKVYLNNEDKLIIETDNCCIDAENNQTTELKGKFEIDAENVAILGALLNDMSFARKEVVFNGNWIFTYKIITKDDEIKSLIKRLESKCKGLDDSYHKCCQEYNSLKAKVEEHNVKPFSRKIKLD